METMRLLREVAQSWRLDWSEFDGRSAKSQLNNIADLAEREHAGEDVSAEVAQQIAEEIESRDAW